jgi:hypothetical protein
VRVVLHQMPPPLWQHHAISAGGESGFATRPRAVSARHQTDLG